MNTITLTGKVTALEWVKTGCLSVKVMTGSWGRTRAGIKTETEVPFVVWFWQGQASAVSRSVRVGQTLIVTGRMTAYTHRAPAYQDSRGRVLTVTRYIVHADRWQVFDQDQDPSDDPGPPEIERIKS
jgi:single-stranded DNA-binding protein